MTKAPTKGEKYRRKRGRPKKDGDREPNGRLSRTPVERRRDDPQNVVLEARSRHMGIPKPTEDKAVKQWREDMRAEWRGFTSGRVLEGAADRPELWSAVKAIATVYTRYQKAIGLPSPYPKAAKLEIAEEVGSDGVDVTASSDIRTEEERVKSATNAMMLIEGILGGAGEGVASVVKATVLHDTVPACMVRYLKGLRAVASEFGA